MALPENVNSESVPLFTAIIALIAEYGVPAVRDEYVSKWAWDGRALHLAFWRQPLLTLHELAHWICASPEQRRHADFLLGTNAPGQREEVAAFIMTIHLAQTLGLAWEWFWYYLGAGNIPAEEFWRVEGTLRELGVVDDEGMPTFAVRSAPYSATLFGTDEDSRIF